MSKKMKDCEWYLEGLCCISHSHYDLYIDEKEPINIACILPNNMKIIKKMVKLYNKESKND